MRGFVFGLVLLILVTLTATLLPVFGVDAVALLGEGLFTALIVGLVTLGVGLLGGSIATAVRGPLRRYYGTDRFERRLRRRGEPLTGRLLDFDADELGGVREINDARALRLRLHYRLRGAKYEGVCRVFASPRLERELRPGARLPLLVDPTAPTRCVIDRNRLADAFPVDAG
jgi:hypothetical protein